MIPHRGDPADRPTWLGRIELGTAIVLAALSVILHVELLTQAGALWRDEVNAVNVAAADTLPALWQSIEFESFPLLWILVLRAVVRLSSSDIPLRLFGFATGLAFLASLSLTDRRLWRHGPLLGLALLGLNPEFIRWGDSIRAYGLGACLILLTFSLVWEATLTPSSKQITIALIVSVASVQCLYGNAPLLAAVIVGCVVVTLRRGAVKRALVPLAIGAFSALTLVPYAVVIRRVAAWRMVCVGASIPELELKAIVAACGPVVFLAWVVVGLAGLLAGAVALTRRDGDARDDRSAYGAVTFSAAIIGFPLFLRAIHCQTKPWYYVSFVTLLVVASETALPVVLFQANIRAVRIALAIAIAAASLHPAWDKLQARQTTIDVIASGLDGLTGPHDLILVNPWYLGLTFERYYRGTTEWTTVPPLESHRLHRFDLIKTLMVTEHVMDPVLARIQRALGDGGRVWIVGGVPISGQTYTDLPPPPLPDTGWQCGPYARLWAFQVWSFLQSHADETKGVPVGNRAMEYERAGLAVASGWHP